MRKKISARAAGYALASGLALAVSGAHAAPEPADPKRQTSWHLYLTAREAFEMKRAEGDGVLFIDVREPVEMMFTGFTHMVDVNVPFLLVNPSKLSPAKPVLAMEPNPGFRDEVMKALAARGLDAATPVILMCRSGGERGAPSARALEGSGLERVFVVVDGFEGDADKDNPNGPWRTLNGWKNSGLPWSYELDPAKVYLRPAP